MMLLRSVLIALAVVLPLRAAADEPDPAEIIDRLRPVREEWLRCVATQAKRLLDTGRPAVMIADTSIRRCQRKEGPVRAALQQELGAAGAARVRSVLRA